MRACQPLKYENFTQEQFDTLKHVARSEGLRIDTSNVDTQFDGIAVRIVHDADKQELTITPAEPFWMAPGVVGGYFHELVSKTLSRTQQVPAAVGVTAEEVKAADAVDVIEEDGELTDEEEDGDGTSTIEDAEAAHSEDPPVAK